MTQALLLTLTLLLPPPEIATNGCDKDTDCKGNRICGDSQRCEDAPTPAPAEPVQDTPTFNDPEIANMQRPPAPTRRIYNSPPPRYVKIHPHSDAGVVSIVLGIVGIGVGSAVVGLYAYKTAELTGTIVDDFSTEVYQAPDFEAIRKHAEWSAPTSIGAGALISSGVVLFITGIVLSAITEERRVSFVPNANGIALRF